MIFVYPALASSTVENRMVPAISKLLEKFFLLQIQEAMSSGTIRIVSAWDGRKYGELQLESKRMSGNVLLEQEDEPGKVEVAKLGKKYENLQRSIDECGNAVNILFRIKGELYAGWEKAKDQGIVVGDYGNGHLANPDKLNLANSIILTDEEMCPVDADFNETTGTIFIKKEHFKVPLVFQGGVLNSQMDKLNSYIGNFQQLSNNIENYRQSFLKDFGKILGIYVQGEKEKEERKKETHKTHGSYKVTTSRGVDLQPTMANMEVKVQYVGGPAGGSSGADRGEKLTIGVGTQVLPSTLTDFDSLKDVLLDDYFSNHYQTIFKSLSRTIARKSINIVDKMYEKLTGKTLMPAVTGKSQVYKDVLLAPRGYVDASTFRKKANSPKYYSYTAAVVIFNKSDITEEDEQNFFLNSAQLQRMFKMGWNTFCILDPQEEEVIFTTMLDGGAIHRLPYSFIFHSIDATDLYKDLDPLRKRVSPMRMKAPGSIKDLGMRLLKQNILYKAIKKRLSGGK